jgi:hypothetical protein
MNNVVNKRSSERGGAGVKFLGVALIIILIFNAGINFIPVAYNGASFKQEMHTAVIQAVAIPGKMSPVDMVKQKLQVAAVNNDLPEDAFVEVKQNKKILEAHVIYTKNVSIIPFGIYNYQYEFDHTVTPVGFLAKN